MEDQVNLHIFNDSVGFFSNTIATFINTIQPGQNHYLNIAWRCSNKSDQIEYGDLNAFLKQNPGLKIHSVIFHSYNYFNKGFIKKIRSACPGQSLKFIWIFWSHEYYQLPEFFNRLYQGFSRRFYLRKVVSFHVEQVRLFIRGQADWPFYGGLKAFQKTFGEFNLFCSFLEGDYDIVMKKHQQVPYSFVSYLSLKDFEKIPNDLTQLKNDIMIGHAGSPILNHYEIVKTLSDLKVTNKILVPLSYGKSAYIEVLKKELQKPGNLQLECMTEYLSKDAYYKKIDSVGFFILNSTCQQALGNIVFFLWAGTKIFVRKETSTYKTLKKQGFYIYSIEEDLNPAGLQPLLPEQKQHNNRLISQQISEEKVKSSWLKILNF